MIVRKGIVAAIRRDGMRDTELGRLAPGDFFGEGGLPTGAGETGTIQALTFVVAYEITPEGLAPLMQERPAIADELASVLSKRNASELLRLGQDDGSAAAKPMLPLRSRIRQLFNL